MSDKKITVSGKTIDCGDMTNEQLLNLYNQLLQRQKLINQKMKDLQND